MRRLLSGLLALMLLAMAGQAMAEGDFSDAFPDRFLAEGEAPVITETSYRSHDLCIEITTQRYERSDVYVADIYIRSLDNFLRYYSKGEWGKSLSTVPAMAKESGAVLALTGDSSQNMRSGWVMGNGHVDRDGIETMNTVRDICIIYNSGEMRAIPSPTAEQNRQVGEELDDIWHIFLFGPSLLDENGAAYTAFTTSTSKQVEGFNPRSALGYYEPGHYCFVQVDGRDTKSVLEPGKLNKGVHLPELAKLMESLGCAAAYNLDGGRSSMLWFGEGLLSTPAAADRYIGDILVIIEGE